MKTEYHFELKDKLEQNLKENLSIIDLPINQSMIYIVAKYTECLGTPVCDDERNQQTQPLSTFQILLKALNSASTHIMDFVCKAYV
jgi:hypothetical protein